MLVLLRVLLSALFFLAVLVSEDAVSGNGALFCKLPARAPKLWQFPSMLARSTLKVWQSHGQAVHAFSLPL